MKRGKGIEREIDKRLERPKKEIEEVMRPVKEA